VPTFSITSFNARWGLTVDDVAFDLTDACRGFGTDVIAVQEVWNPEGGPGGLAAAADELGYRLIEVPLAGSFIVPKPEITAEPHEMTGTWGIGLLTRLPIRSSRIVDLGRLVDRWDVATRHAIVAELDVEGVAVTVATAHLSFTLPNAFAQLRRLDGFLPRHHPSVAVGDCNLWGSLASLAAGGRRRAVRGRTWPAHRPHSQLDHILVSSDVEVDDSRVLPAAGSDHRPVRATLRVVDPTGGRPANRRH
jgi:endonuclease/exonuclease/phosphatase family metal-dependent hydrolase